MDKKSESEKQTDFDVDNNSSKLQKPVHLAGTISEEFCHTEKMDNTDLGRVVELAQESWVDKKSNDRSEVGNEDSKDSSVLEESTVEGGSSELRSIYLQLLENGYFNRVNPSGLGWHVDTTFMSCRQVEDRHELGLTYLTNDEACTSNCNQAAPSLEKSASSNQRTETNETSHHCGDEFNKTTDPLINIKDTFKLIPQIPHTNKIEAISLNDENSFEHIVKTERSVKSNNYHETNKFLGNDGMLEIDNFNYGSKLINERDEESNSSELVLINQINLSEESRSNQQSPSKSGQKETQKSTGGNWSGKYDVRNFDDNNKKDFGKMYEKLLYYRVDNGSKNERQSKNLKQSILTCELNNNFVNNKDQLEKEKLMEKNENIVYLFHRRFLEYLRQTDNGCVRQEDYKAAMVTGLNFSKWMQKIVQENDQLKKFISKRSSSTNEKQANYDSHIMAFLLNDPKNSDSECELFEMREISEEDAQNKLGDPLQTISESMELSPKNPENDQKKVVYCLENSSGKEMIIREKTNATDWTNCLLKTDSHADLEKQVTTDINITKPTLTFIIRKFSTKILIMV
ncbi:uncharacterized protein LOC111046912 isoform X2 [Nilaparvata lugens]|nr:uncharacterized protein LOC111046912 isoform X2 [Nilaparvata lugens]XP_039296270.1 uncharacterized protein LOC111046912 isoform X2 [Nilaparvata lugens]